MSVTSASESAGPPPDDDLYPAAFRLARMYAILSPRVLVQDLKIDRERAERLLVLLEERGAVGPTFITGTGARESRVNITQDEAPTTPESLYVGTDADLGRRTLLIAIACALLGLAFELALYWVGETSCGGLNQKARTNFSAVRFAEPSITKPLDNLAVARAFAEAAFLCLSSSMRSNRLHVRIDCGGASSAGGSGFFFLGIQIVWIIRLDIRRLLKAIDEFCQLVDEYLVPVELEIQ